MIKRIIPCLLLKDRGLIKTVKFSKPTYIGDPINAVKIFNDKEVDELMIMDIYATKEKRLPDVSYLEDIVSEAFMPIGYGGGVHTIDQITQILKVGVEKISINYHSHQDLEFIRQATKEFGSSTIVGAIDVKNDIWGRQRVYKQNGRKNTKKTPVDWAKSLEDAGVGELFINSIDRDGTYQGYDIDLIKSITESTSIPVIACGGAGGIDDVKEVLNQGKASAAAAGSIFVFYGPQRAVLISYPSLKEINYIID